MRGPGDHPGPRIGAGQLALRVGLAAPDLAPDLPAPALPEPVLPVSAPASPALPEPARGPLALDWPAFPLAGPS